MNDGTFMFTVYDLGTYIDIEGVEYRKYEHLYVGYTTNIGRRISEHANEKWWWPQVMNIDLYNYDTYEEAVAMEEFLISRHQPKYNFEGVIRPYIRPAAPKDLLEDVRVRLSKVEHALGLSAAPASSHHEEGPLF
jgi:hypothetical protein